mgnify:CR=1 FL=1
MSDKASAVIEELPRLRRYAIALLGDRGRVDDLVQDTVERALSRLHLWKSGTNMRSWLFTIMHNLHVNNLRRDRAMGDAVPLEDWHPALSRPAEQHDAVRMVEVADALATIPLEQREVVLLIALEGLSYREAAEVTGVPMGTVMSRLARGREALRRITDGTDSPVFRRVK